MSLNELAQEVHSIAKAEGFWPDTSERLEAARNPAEVLMLIVSEATEAMEAIRDGMPLNEARTSWVSTRYTVAHEISSHGLRPGTPVYRLRDTEPWRELTDDVYRQLGFVGKPEGVPSELADIIIRTLDACAAWGIDIETAMREKIIYNAQREHLHGRAR